MTIESVRYQAGPRDRPKTVVRLAASDILTADVQLVSEGGETNLHSHSGQDGFWFVLRGQASFYGEAGEPVAVLGVHEGVFIPRDAPYWFESSSDEALEILHVAARAQDVVDRRTDLRPRVRRASQPRSE